MLWFFSLLLCIRGEVNEYSDDFVLGFLNRSITSLEISEECRKSISTLLVYLKNDSTDDALAIFYFQSFTTGPSSSFLNRDQDRWIYKGYECIRAAYDTFYKASDNPISYCYTYDDTDGDRQAYAVCLPTQCSEERVKFLQEFQSMTNPLENGKVIEWSECLRSRHEKQWFWQIIPVMDFVFQIFLFILVCIATKIDRKSEMQPRLQSYKLLLCFSACKGFATLCHYPKNKDTSITCLGGLRVLAFIWMLIGHSMVVSQVYMENSDTFKEYLAINFWDAWITNAMLSVDTFFLISGCVMSFTFFKKWLNSEPKPTWTSDNFWYSFYRHRAVRLWPAYIFVIMTITLRFSKMNFHPFWPPMDPAVQCPRYFWQNLLFINSFLDNRCLPWTWYIGTEFIFFLLSPPILLLLLYIPRNGLRFCLGTILLSMAGNYRLMIEKNFPPAQMYLKQPEVFNENFISHHLELYIKPQYRVTPYMIGILLGYFLAQTPPYQVHLKSRFFIGGGWILCFFCLVFSIFGLYPSINSWDWPLYHKLFGLFHVQIFTLGLCWLIYACHTGIGKPLDWILSSRIAVPLANLGYSAYLFHMIPVVFTYMLTPFPIWFEGKIQIFVHIAVQLIISYCFALFCYLCVEMPVANMERLFTRRQEELKKS